MNAKIDRVPRAANPTNANLSRWIQPAGVLFTFFVSLLPPAARAQSFHGGSLELIPFGASWRFSSSAEDFYSTNPRFFGNTFDDSEWAPTNGSLAARDANGNGATVTPILAPSDRETIYFRTRFQYELASLDPSHTGDLSLLLEGAGTVFLNGFELSRLRLPAGPVTRETSPSERADPWLARRIESFAFSPAMLRDGENVVAVALHRYPNPPPRVAFDLRLSLQRPVLSSSIDLGMAERGTEVITLHDMDQSGTPDIVYTFDSRGHGIRFRKNLGGTLLSPAESIDEQFWQADSIDIVDLDGDGRSEIIGASLTTADRPGIRIYREVEEQYELAQSFTDVAPRTIIVADMDGDSRDDLLYQEFTEPLDKDYPIVWRRNLGDGSLGEPTAITSVDFISGLALADLDRDGQSELLASVQEDGTVFWIDRNPAGEFTERHELDRDLNQPRDLFAGDLDGDADPDILVYTFDGIYFYRNRGNGEFEPPWLVVSDAFLKVGHLVDLDHDEDLDFLLSVLGPRGDAIWWLENEGHGHLIARRSLMDLDASPISQPLISSVGLTTGDYNLDGRVDVLASRFASGEILLFQNLLQSVPRIVSFSAEQTTAAAGAEVRLTWEVEGAETLFINDQPVTGNSATPKIGDRDQWFELTAKNAAGSVSAGVTVFVPKDTFREEVLLHEGGIHRIQRLAVADLDNSGQADIVYAGYGSSEVGWLPNDGNNQFPSKVLLQQPYEQPADIALGDFDQDGDIDVVACANRQPLMLYQNEGGGNFSEPRVIANVNGFKIYPLDLNGDGRLDLVIQDDFDDTKVLIGDGSGAFASPLLLSLGRGVDIEFFDSDNDGTRDALELGTNSLRFYPGEAPLRFSRDRAVTIVTALRSAKDLLVDDFTGDGLRDLVIVEKMSNATHLLAAIGHGQYAEPRNLADLRGKLDSTLGDFDGDGDNDIAILTEVDRGNHRSIVWLESDGLGNFSDPQTITSSLKPGKVMASGDLDLDGDLDLIFAEESNGIWWINNVLNPELPPTIESFGAVDTTVQRGMPLTLRWSVTGETSLRIEPDVGPVSGGLIEIIPRNSTTYTLIAENRAGQTKREFSIEVVDRPVIHSFSVDVDEPVYRTSEITFTWNVSGAETVFITPGIGQVTGDTLSLPIYESTTFRLEGANRFGEVHQEITVAVRPDLLRFGDPVEMREDLSTVEALTTADLNLDGCPDIIGFADSFRTSRGGVLFWIPNGHSSGFGETRLVDDNDVRTIQDLDVADVDGDGWPDVAAAAVARPNFEDSRLSIFRSDEARQWEEKIVDDGDRTYSALTLADMDADGQLDVVAGSAAQGILVWYRHEGGFQFSAPLFISALVENLVDLQAVDFDRDGDIDVLAGLDQSDSGLVWFENLGENGFSSRKPLIPRGKLKDFDLGDLDGDGHLDCAAALRSDNNFYLYFNDGEGQFSQRVQVDTGGNTNAMFISIDDLDSDGDLDVFHGELQKSWSENIGPRIFQFRTFGLQSNVYTELASADLDCDGDLDYVVSQPNDRDRLGWVENLQSRNRNTLGRTLAEDGLLAFGDTLLDRLPVPEGPIDETILQVTLRANHGRLTLGMGNALSFAFDDAAGTAAGDGVDDSVMIFRGTSASLSGALATLVYRPMADFQGNDALTLNVAELLPDHSEAVVSLHERIPIVVESISDPPRGTDRSLSLQRNDQHIFALSDFGFEDAQDSPPDEFVRVQFVTTPESGRLRLGDATVAAGDFVPVAPILRGDLRYTANPSDTTHAAVRMNFRVEDNGSMARGGKSLSENLNTFRFTFGDDTQPEGFVPFLWEVRNGDSLVYLMGSIHRLAAEDYPLDLRYDEVFEAADQVFFESDLSVANTRAVGALYREVGLYPSGDSLRQNLSEDLFNRLERYFKDHNEPFPWQFRPWLVNDIIRDIELEETGLKSELGVDLHFFDRSVEAEKPVFGLESAAFQIGLLAQSTDAEEIAIMERRLADGGATTRENALFITDIWRAGDHAEIVQLNDLQKTLDPEGYQLFLVDRNLNWLPQIESLLTIETTSLVIVGAAHLLGDDSLVQLLLNQGFAVELYTKREAESGEGPATADLPVVVVQPQDQEVVFGASVAFRVEVENQSMEALTYQWYHNLTPIPSGTNAILSLPSVKGRDEGVYRVVITTTDGRSIQSRFARLSVIEPRAPVIESDLPDIVADRGHTVRLEIGVAGTPPFEYQWFFNNESLPGATASSLVLESVELSQAGEYWVFVTGPFGEFVSSRTARLEVSAPMPLRLTQSPQDQSVARGSGVTFTVSATGSEPFDYRWFRNGRPLAGEVGTTLSITAATPDQAGEYLVTVRDRFGESVTAAARLTVVSALPPTILVQPTGISVEHLDMVTFSVSAQGTEPLRYQWSKDNQMIPNATTAELIIESASADHAGKYQVLVTDAFGQSTASTVAELMVRPPSPPRFVHPPRSVGVALGQPFELEIFAAGSQPLSFIWFKDGRSISGERSATLNLALVGEEDGGTYRVIVENDLQLIASNTFEVIVVDPSQSPTNDRFANRVDLTGNPVRFAGQTQQATIESREPLHGPDTGGRSVWFRWVADRDGMARLLLARGDFAASAVVYVGSEISGLESVAAVRREALQNGESHVEFPVQKGTEFALAIATDAAPAGRVEGEIRTLADSPRIQSHLSGREIVLQWDWSGDPVVLEATGGLSNPIWRPVGVSVDRAGELYTVRLPVDADTHQFFRLATP